MGVVLFLQKRVHSHQGFIPAREFWVDGRVVTITLIASTIFSLILSILSASQPVNNSLWQHPFVIGR